MTCRAGKRAKIPLALFDFRARSCIRYKRLAPKLRKSAAYPVKIIRMCKASHPCLAATEVNTSGCCPVAATKVSKNTRGKITIPGVVVLYTRYEIGRAHV